MDYYIYILTTPLIGISLKHIFIFFIIFPLFLFLILYPFKQTSYFILHNWHFHMHNHIYLYSYKFIYVRLILFAFIQNNFNVHSSCLFCTFTIITLCTASKICIISVQNIDQVGKKKWSSTTIWKRNLLNR